jgi:hypothetical protein
MAPQWSDRLTCGQVLDLLDRHVDGELDGAVAALVTAHTERCRDCAAELDFVAEIRREFDRLPRFDAPSEVIAHAREAGPETHLGSAAVSMGSRMHRRSVALLAAAAVVAIAASIVLLRPETPPEQPAVDTASIDRTRTEARLALALIADATRRAEDELMEGVLKERVLGTAVRGISRSFEFANRSDREPAASPIPHPTPRQGGMI